MALNFGYSPSGQQSTIFSGTGDIFNSETWSRGTGLADLDLFKANASAGSSGAGLSDFWSGSATGASGSELGAGVAGAGVGAVAGGSTFMGMGAGGWGIVGSVGSKLAGGGYSEGTGGTFTTIGATVGSIFPVVGTAVGAAVGAVVDIIAGGAMGNSAEGKARKEAGQYWQSAYMEMQGLASGQAAQRSTTIARQGASGVTMGSSSLMKYRRTMRAEHQKQWMMEYQRHAEKYKAIRSGGAG